MYIKSKTAIRGSVTVEACLLVPILIMIFSGFLYIFGYINALYNVRARSNEILYNNSIKDYSIGISLPDVEALFTQKELKALNIKYIFSYTETFGSDITLVSKYTYYGILGSKKVEISTAFPKWQGDGITYKKDNVWLLSNYRRGVRIEELFGGNLPHYFPIIDSYNENSSKAISITSINTTLASYLESNYLYNRMEDTINKLLNYIEESCEDITIYDSDIDKKEVIFVFPENPLTSEQVVTIDEIIKYGKSININIEIKRYQKAYVSKKSVK